MGGRGTLWILGTLALASGGVIGCGTSKSSDGGDSGDGGTAGLTAAGTSGQGSSGRASGGAGTGGQAGSAAGFAGTSGGGSGGGAGINAGTGGRAGDGGASATGGMSGEAGAAGEGAGASGAGNAGRGGSSASIDCSGTFGEPHIVFDPQAEQLFSPTLTADEMELLYALGDGITLQYFHSKRTSKTESFGAGEPLPELDAACSTTDSRTIDLTSDGLRAYLVCYGTGDPDSHTLRIAVRPSLDAPFVLDPMSYGSVGPSAGVAPGELTLYSSGLRPGQEPALAFERATTSEPFGEGTEIPGLEGVLLLTPDVSADGLSLFGSVMGSIVLATRPTVHDPFSTAETIIAGATSGEWISPTISEDCRSLYAVRQLSPLALHVFER
jgi:hypothetical protein